MTDDATGEVVALARRFYLAFREHDWSSVRTCLADGAELSVSGRSPIAGTFTGAEATVGQLRTLVDETDGTFRPVLEDGWDVCASRHHVIVFDWFRAERAGRELRAYLYFVIAAEDGRIVRMFVHSSEQYEFDRFFAAT